MVKGPVSPPPVWPVPMAPDQLLVSSHCSYSQQWFRTCFPNLSPFIHIYIYSFIQFMVEIQEKNPTVFPPWIQIYSDPWYFPARHAERQWYQRLDRRRAETVPGKSPCLLGKSTSNGHFRKLCWFTGGYTECRPRFNILLLLLSSQVYYWK